MYCLCAHSEGQERWPWFAYGEVCLYWLSSRYKGWKFYNPTTKKVVISERADFDERYFPMSKCPSSASFPAPSIEVESTPSTTLAPAPRLSLAVPRDRHGYG